MAYIVELPNPFEPQVKKMHTHPGGITINEWLKLTYPGRTEFPVPTICILNGIPLKREGWNRTIGRDDKICFVTVQNGYLVIIIALVVALVVLTILIARIPKAPGSAPEGDPVYSTRGQQNSVRLGQPIECPYGRNRIFPAFATLPYFQYVNNDQFQYVVFCIGQGYYDIEQILISDTDIDNFQEVEYHIVGPGESMRYFPMNVHTSVEPGDLELFAPDQSEYVAPGYQGPFVANPTGTVIHKIEIDLVLPRGLYFLDSKGITHDFSVQFEAEYRLIDDAGAPLGPYFSLTAVFPETITFATPTPQRITYSKDVTAGRYEVRVRRVGAAESDPRRQSQFIWEGLRGFTLERLTSNPWGDVTLLAVKIRASNNLNTSTEVQFNVICTRKLPMYLPDDTSADSNGWTPPIATRSIVWALVDVFRSAYGGRITDDNFFDWETLLELDATYTSRNEHFDWIFRDAITCWEAAKTIATVGRAVPLLVGSLISMRREAPQSIPVTMFSQENVAKGNFKWGVKLWDLDEFDSIRMEYTDVSTGYKQETVLCTLPGGTTDHPQDIRYAGCQDRDHAYRDGLFILAKIKKIREQIRFTTGMEGHIPTYGDLIAISHDVPRWSQSGIVMDAVLESGSNYLLTLSEPLDWSTVGAHEMAFRGRKAEWVGPYAAYQMPDPHQVIVHIPHDSTGDDYDFQLTGKTEPVIWMFGVANEIGKLAKVVEIMPQGGEAVEVTAVNYDPTIFDYDTAASALTSNQNLKAADLPGISQLRLNQVDANLPTIVAHWAPAFGAKSYVAQVSADGISWQDRGTTKQTSIELVAPQYGEVWVRVAAVNSGQGEWIEDSIELKTMTEIQLYTEWEALEWKVGWDQILNASGYQLRIYDYIDSARPLLRTVDLDAENVALGGSAYNFSSRVYAYDYDEAVIDGATPRELLVEVESKFAGVLSGDIQQRILTNSVPTPPTSPASAFTGTGGGNAHYTLSWDVPHEDDLIRIVVWLETSSGFDPNVATPILDNTLPAADWTALDVSLAVDVPLVAGAHAARYWRVCVFDVWGNEIDTNITAQQTIPAFP